MLQRWLQELGTEVLVRYSDCSRHYLSQVCSFFISLGHVGLCCVNPSQGLVHDKYSTIELHQRPPKCAYTSNFKQSDSLYLREATVSLGSQII